MSSIPYTPASVEYARQSPGRRFLGLLSLSATLTVGAAVLYRMAGPPHLPAALPSWNAVRTVLMGSDVPYEALAYLLSTAAWVLWFWIVGSMLLRMLLTIIETLTRGAAWARSLRSLSDRITLPMVRKLVDGTVVAVTVVQLVGRTVPSAAAAPAPVTPVVSVVGTTAHAATLATQPAGEQRSTTYRVREGDNLWVIAEQFYGDGSQFPRIISANVDRPMGNGEWFPPNGVIQSGWVLLIPESTKPHAQAAGAAAPQQVEYTVQRGDMLRTIAARYYGDERRWPEIFKANVGVASLPDGRVLTNPNLIWPGMRLTIPGVAPAAPATPDRVAAPGPAPVPAASHAPAKAPPAPVPAKVVAQSATASSTAAATPTPARTPSPATTEAVPTSVSHVSSVTASAQRTPTVLPAPVPAVRHEGIGTQLESLLPTGLGALATGTGIFLLARRRARGSLSEPPVPPDWEAGIPVRDGWADPAYSRTFAKHLDGGTEPALLVAEQVLHCLGEAGVEDVTLVSMVEGRHMMGLTLRAGLAAQERLIQIAPDLAERLGARGVASRTPDHDILLRLSNLALLRLVVRPSEGAVSPVPLLAMGVSQRGEAFHVNWRALGNVLIAGEPGGGTDIVLTNLLTTLAARCHPDRVRLYAVAPRDSLPLPLRDLPHQCGRSIDPTDSERLEALLADLRDELERRMHQGTGDGTPSKVASPEIVLVVSELADLPDDNDAVAFLGAQGPANGMHVVAATTRREALNDAALLSFDTRLVLRTLDEDASIRLLGRPDAADLGGGGDLFVRIDGRDPVRIQSFCVEPEHLNHLVDMMHAAYRDAPVGEEPASVDVEPDPVTGDDGDDEADEAAEELLVDEKAAQNGVAEPLAPTLSAIDAAETMPTTAIGSTAVISTNGHAKMLSLESGPPSDQTPGLDLPAEAASARIQIRCFGELEVFGDGRPISAQGQYLPWELLIYLALQPSAGVPKQELLRVLWPNTDSELGGRRLRAAMVRLRAVLSEQVPGLPADVVRGQRNGTCHLDRGLVWSDAQQFLALYQQARRLPSDQTTSILEQARALYRGELFTQPYFGWMDRRSRGLTLRERFREQHATITFQLAERYEAEGRPAWAVPLYAELLHAQPTLQDVARRLYRCCAQIGDRSTLSREHARLVGALEQMHSTAPPGGAPAYALERETVTVYEEALAALDGIGVPNNTS